MFEQRDEYSASQVRGLGCGFTLLWIVATAAGGTLGQLAGQGLAGWFLPADLSLPLLMLAMVPAGLLTGLLVGAFQGLVLLRFIKASGLRDWVLASMVGGVLRWAVLGPVSALMVLTIDTGFIQCNVIIPLLLFGAASGAAFGLPQAYVFHRHLSRTLDLDWWAWVLANAAGGIFYLPIVMLSGWTGSAVAAMSGIVPADRFVPALIAMSLNWLFTGIITSLPLRDRLRHALRPRYAEFG